ncbi:STAS domain-containing protein [Rhodococcus erythropolis]|uniref:STAS domain-containing protein n=1 Tax=Rhodococcus erythropolis TaxID=1833 RepID=UPI001BE74E91|nr:STAS domain-containing protein [Rhodococcus erythropolis]MBT2266008.1 hypothetical protein [Rhodococcus erythropolis]
MNDFSPDPPQQHTTNSPRRAVPFGGWLPPTWNASPRNIARSARTPEGEDVSMRAASAVSIAFTASPAAHGIIRYCVSGVIDATTCGSFSAYLDEITAAASPFILDLTGVPFVCVGGLTLIETLAHTTTRLDIRWALVADYSLHRFLTLLNIDANIPSFDTAQAALAHLTNAVGDFRPSG